MAKTQNLSLNPTKISGTCGRLMCCLKYEQDAYEDLLKHSPKNESFVDTVDGRGTVVDVNLLRQTVRVRMEDQPDQVNCYKNCDICVLRNGKAKKTDPPIPKDLAPISSRPRPAKKFVELPDEPLPEVIITGRDMPPVKPEPVWEPELAGQPAEEKTEGGKSSSRRRKRKKSGGNSPKPEAQDKPAGEQKPKQDKPKGEQKPKQDKPKGEQKPRQDKPKGEQKPRSEQKPEGEQPRAEGTKSSSHHHRRRRRPRGPKPGGEGKAE